MKSKKITTLALATALSLTSIMGSSGITLDEAKKENKDVKNVIVLIADGMSVDGTTLTRWYNSYDANTGTVNTNEKLAMDEMASGLVRTYWMNNGVVGAITDSAPGGTAFATGVKTNNKFIGVNDKQMPLANMVEGAKLAGKATGIISTSQIMHATPAAYSSHYPDRSKEEIIAEQQVYNNIDMVLGGGYGRLTDRADGENLVEQLQSKGYDYAVTGEELAKTDGKTWGMFAKADMAYEMDRATFSPTQPSLSEMTKKAIGELSKDEDGFFLMVEGSKIDWAAHANDPIGLISDINSYDDAVEESLNFAKKDGNTMVIAITDHGNGGLTIGNSATTSTYDNDPVTKFIAPLKKATLTGEGVEKKLNADRTNIKEVMATYYGISDLTAEEELAIKETKSGSMNYTVGPMISKRASLGWTTGGHTGEEIVLYTYLPKNQRITGVIENTDIAKISSAMWNINLESVTKNSYNNANQIFADKGATVTVDKADENNPVLVVVKDNNELKVFENKDYVELNGTKVETKTVNVNVKDTFYVSKDVIDLIK